jgi:type II secretory pathway pseudopilin PulG
MRRPRAGFTLIESCAAAALLAASLAIVVGLLTSVARQRQAAERHAKALIVADNLLQRLTGEPYAAITTDRADELRQEANRGEALPNSTVAIKVVEDTGPPVGKRIEVDVTWPATGDRTIRRHQVATWVYKAKGNP